MNAAFRPSRNTIRSKRSRAAGWAQGVNQGQGALFATDAKSFMADERLGHEVFGSSSLVVRCPDVDTLVTLSERLEGQLTATLQMEPADTEIARRLIPILERKCGRILANGWPTGVEVGHAMVHGGPFPATSDSRTTSVGSLAIRRFLRPVCYQDLAPDLLPEELRDDSPAEAASFAGRRPCRSGRLGSAPRLPAFASDLAINTGCPSRLIGSGSTIETVQGETLS